MLIAKRTLGTTLLVATVLVVLVYAVLPSRAYFEQREDLADARADLSAIEASNAELTAQIEALSTREQIEIVARRDYNLVYPGQETYAILPAPPPPVALPASWPFWPLAEILEESGL